MAESGSLELNGIHQNESNVDVSIEFLIKFLNILYIIQRTLGLNGLLRPCTVSDCSIAETSRKRLMNLRALEE